MTSNRNRGLVPAVRACGFIIWHWEDLVEARFPGTRRPWAQTMSRAESRSRFRQSEGRALGMAEAPAPLHLDVLDAAIEVHRTGWELAHEASRVLGDAPADLPTVVGEDARPYWAYLARVLDRLADQQPGTALEVYRRIHHARRVMAAALRLVMDGHVLDADCPWCGSRPLKVRIVAEEPVVVCESRRVCEPPEADCGTWVKGRPAWIQPEWDWLARRIRHAEERSA